MRHLRLLLSLTLLIPYAHAQGIPSREELELRLREPVPESSDPAAEKIVSLYRQLITGSDDTSAVRSLHRVGSRREGIQESTLTEYWVTPEQWRIEQTEKNRPKPQPLIRGWNANGGWQYDLRTKNPFPAELPRDNLSDILREHDPIGWLLARDLNQYVLKYEGEAKSKRRPHHLVKAYLPNGRTIHYYFDKDTLMLTRINEQRIIGTSIVEIDTFITRYDRMGSQWVEKEWELHFGGQLYGKTAWDNVTINSEIDESLFQMPEVKEFWLRQK